MRKIRGSNQHTPKYQFGSSNKFILAVFIFLAGISAGIDWYHAPTESYAYTIYADPTPTTTPTPTISEGEGSESGGSTFEPEVVGEMEQIIIDTFGDHSDKAFKLLECENRNLDPKAVHRNWSETRGQYWSTDYGLFQINDKWQGITHEGKAQQFLFDPVINTRIAWRLYEDSGYNFSLWTCGKNLNI